MISESYCFPDFTEIWKTLILEKRSLQRHETQGFEISKNS